MLRSPAKGVYVAGGAPDTPHQRVLLACTGGAAGAVASFLTCAALFGLWAFPLLPHVTVRRRSSARSRLAVVHRADLDPKDVTMVGIIPCTTPARMLVDCASVLAADELQEMVDAAFVRGVVTYDGVLTAIARASARPGRKGIPMLLRALDAWAPGITHDSVPEARLFRLLVAWGYPVPQTLYKVFTDDGEFVAEVDGAWPDRKVALEYEGALAHAPSKHAHDESRYDAVRRVAWTVVPVSKADLRPGNHDRLRADIDRALRRP
ncbi:MAG: hypothetical protein H0W25_01695 [Acidimicrobiia bacterium]|nr:hypothetical protein [Acidimicrobiia bacterium]